MIENKLVSLQQN